MKNRPLCFAMYIFIMANLMVSHVSYAITLHLLDTYNQANLHVGLRYLDYVETSNNPSEPHRLDSETGFLPNVTIGLMRHIGRLVVATHMSLNRGKSDYKGFIQYFDEENDHDVLEPSQARSTQTITELALHMGWLTLLNNVLLQPFLELEWRRWHRGSTPVGIVNDTSINGYTEVYMHDSVFTGLEFASELTPRIIGRFAVALGRTFNARMESDVPYGLWGVQTVTDTFKLGSHLTGFVRGTLSYQLLPHIYGDIAMEYRYFRYGKSKQNNFGIFEPDSKTHVLDMQLGLSFD